jgi:50S ribosomal subunit-associated GTPase HflX
VYNKADLLTVQQRRKLKRDGHNILVSAKSGEGLPEMLAVLEDILSPKLSPHKLTLPYNQNVNIGNLYRLAVIKKKKYTEKGINVCVETTDENWKKIQSMMLRVNKQ